VNLLETYAEDRRKLHEMTVRYGNAAISGASEVAYLLGRADRQLELMEKDLEKGIQDGGAHGGSVPRGARERAEGGSPDAA